jgi:hypothetical protein
MVAALALGMAATAQAEPPVPSPWTFTNYAPLLNDVSCASATTCVAVGQQGMILRSTGDPAAPLAWADVGLTDPETLASVTCTGTRCLAVSSDRKIPATAKSRVFRSTDSGATWTSSGVLPELKLPGKTTRTTRSASAIACDPGGAPVCYAAGFTGGVWRSADGGVNWKPLDVDAAGSYTKVACAAQGRCVAVAGADLASPATPSIAVLSGTSVDTIKPPAPEPKWSSALGVACDSATRCLVTSAAGSYATLSLPDKAWGAVQTLPAKAKASPPTITDLSCPSANTCIGLATGLVLRTTNLSSSSDTSWQRRPNGDAIPFSLKAISCAQSPCVTVGAGATWFASADLGFNWGAVNLVPELDGVTCAGTAPGTCVGAGKDSVGVGRADGTLWTAPVYKHSGLDTKWVGCFDAAGCMQIGRTGALATTDLRVFDGLFPPTFDVAGVSAADCLNATLCVAVVGGATLTSLDGSKTVWSQTSFPPVLPAAMDCVPGKTDPVTCFATTADGYVLRGTMTLTDKPRWDWVYTTADADSALAAIASSPAPVSCTATGKAGEIWVSDPADPTVMNWHQRQLLDKLLIDDRPDFATVTCPASGVCLAGGEHGGLAAVATTADNWKTYTYDEVPALINGPLTMTAANCETLDRCLVAGSTVLVGTRSPGITPAR